MKKLFDNYDLDKLDMFCQATLAQCETECDYLMTICRTKEEKQKEIKNELLNAEITIFAYVAYELSENSDLFNATTEKYISDLNKIEAKYKI